MLVNVRCQKLGSWTEKTQGSPKNKERVQDFGNLSHSWIDYYHFPKYLKGVWRCLIHLSVRNTYRFEYHRCVSYHQLLIALQ